MPANPTCARPVVLSCVPTACGCRCCLPLLCRVLRASDLFCVANAVLTSCMLIRTFGTGSNSGMTWHYQLPMLVYACMNVTQMALLLLQPEVYQKHRFQVRDVLAGTHMPGMLGDNSFWEEVVSAQEASRGCAEQAGQCRGAGMCGPQARRREAAGGTSLCTVPLLTAALVQIIAVPRTRLLCLHAFHTCIPDCAHPC